MYICTMSQLLLLPKRWPLVFLLFVVKISVFNFYIILVPEHMYVRTPVCMFIKTYGLISTRS